MKTKDREDRALRRAVEQFCCPLAAPVEDRREYVPVGFRWSGRSPRPPSLPRLPGVGWLVPVPMLVAFATGNHLIGWWLHAICNAVVMALILFAPARIWWPGRWIARALGWERDRPGWLCWVLIGAGCGLLIYCLPFMAMHGHTW